MSLGTLLISCFMIFKQCQSMLNMCSVKAVSSPTSAAASLSTQCMLSCALASGAYLISSRTVTWGLALIAMKLMKMRTTLQRAGMISELAVCTVQVTTPMWTHESLIQSHTPTPMPNICTLGYAKTLPTHETHMQTQYLRTTCLTLITHTHTHENPDLWSWVRVSVGTGMGQHSMTWGYPW